MHNLLMLWFCWNILASSSTHLLPDSCQLGTQLEHLADWLIADECSNVIQCNGGVDGWMENRLRGEAPTEDLPLTF